MNRGKVTDTMRKKWLEQYSFLSAFICPYMQKNLMNQKEKNFIESIHKLLLAKKDLTFHQSKWLNDIYNKYVE